ncbi:hypothetical protein A0256_01485 [Mucilaginibacter sp. PAMC 26640]|nr:hypothetical protein A0256_01485 [Mucilaginibacter sp. PAMC 26640]
MEITPDFVKSFVVSDNLPLLATQTKLCIPIINRLCQKMANGIKFEEIKVYNNLIIDGHHRFISALIMKFNLGKVEGNITSATTAITWDKVIFEEKDWDTQAKIEYLNELDAKYNGLEIDFVKQISLR